MRHQIAYGHSQVVIWIHQPGGRCNDAVPVGVWIVGESDVILILKVYQTCHRIRTRRVHSYLAIVIDSHERKSRIDCWVRDVDVQVIYGVDWLPIRFRRTAERVYSQLQASAADRVHVDDIFQILDVRQHEILLVCRLSLDRITKWYALYARSVA